VAKKKLIHFTENLSFKHLFQPRYSDLQPQFRLKGRWNRDFFKNDHPITLELGCGKGEFTVGLALKEKTRNYIGIDFKGARLWRGCKTVEEQNLANVAFIRSRADHIEQLFDEGEVNEIWITFPEPQPGKERKRLTAPVFLRRYQRIMSPNSIVHLKTDDVPLLTYTMEILKEFPVEILLSTENLYGEYRDEPVAQIQTFYESMWLEQGKPIGYVKFRFRT